MAANYTVCIYHHGSSDVRDELAAAIQCELREVGLHRTITLDIREGGPPPHDVPAVGIYIGSAAARGDGALVREVEAALQAGITVIPVVNDLADFTQLVPNALQPINGFAWDGADPARHLARVALEELGIEERQRRVFVSHKREDGLAAAEQLHDALSHIAFQPFIDRFAIRSGEPVQQTIADALEEHAFLLLLETPLAHTSEWVFDEVDYALSHTLGALIVSWPGNPEPVPGSQGLPRLHLLDGDLLSDSHGYDVLTQDALDRVIETVEGAHASGLVRRRRMLVKSTEEAAIAGCASCVPLPGWRLKVDHYSTTTVVGTAPRLPTADDLQRLDEAAQEYAPATAVLVHSARVLRAERRHHLAWVVGSRDLALTPENAIGGRWTCH